MGVSAPRRDERHTKSQNPRAGAVDPSSVSQPWEAVSPEEIQFTFYKFEEFAECNVFISERKISDSTLRCAAEKAKAVD